MRRTVVLEVVYPHSPERVWRALTDREALAEWLLPNNFEPRVGHKFQFWSPPQPGSRGVVECEVVEFDEPRRLSYTWQDEPDQAPTLVTWTLEATNEGTRLRLEHEVREGQYALAAGLVPASRWDWVLRVQLPEILTRLGETWPPRARRTLLPGSFYPMRVSDRSDEGDQPARMLRLRDLPLRGGPPHSQRTNGPRTTDPRAGR